MQCINGQSCPWGLGVKNGPAMFQRMISWVLRDFPDVLVYIDDILLGSAPPAKSSKDDIADVPGVVNPYVSQGNIKRPPQERNSEILLLMIRVMTLIMPIGKVATRRTTFRRRNRMSSLTRDVLESRTFRSNLMRQFSTWYDVFRHV
jgi:hypothetical protein